VLLVEPHDDTRLLYATIFEEAGYAVHAVANGADAIAAAALRLPDVIVMEMAVPEVDGFAILQRVRSDPMTADIPAVVVTSILHFNVPERARQSGATLVLSKPILPEPLLEAVDDAVDATPAPRITRRHLRRALLTLQKLGSAVDDQARARTRALIDRWQIAVLALDDRGRCVAASRGAESLTGFDRADLLSMSIFDTQLGSDLPLARRWDEFRGSTGIISETTIRDRMGRPLPVHAAFATIMPDLHVAALSLALGDVA
jgi:PAS domain S-box-containing protein